MTLNQLLALDAIVATGTFRAAAERLNKAQSAVSHQIRKKAKYSFAKLCGCWNRGAG